MKIQTAFLIAKEEWRYWRRSRLGVITGLTLLMLVLASIVSTTLQVETERAARENFQANAEQTFREQPARHPHGIFH